MRRIVVIAILGAIIGSTFAIPVGYSLGATHVAEKFEDKTRILEMEVELYKKRKLRCSCGCLNDMFENIALQD